MKLKKLFILPALAASMLSFTSCTDILDQEPLDSFTDDAVWGDLRLAEVYLNAQYANLMPENAKGTLFACYTDEVYHKHGYATENYTQGYLSPEQSGIGWDDTTWDPWYDYYRYINKINLFLERIDDVPGDDTYRDTLKGQGLFLRAWNYHMLYGLFGRVVIVDQTYDLDHEFGEEGRADLDKVADFIVKDLDEAAKLLHNAEYGPSDLGRATEGAALALKSRVLLWKASPLFGTPSREKWQAAADAAKAVIDLNQYYLRPVNNSEEYAALFFDTNNPEVIFEKIYDPKWGAGENISYLHQAPMGPYNGYQGWGTYNPCHEVAAKFQLKDGSHVDFPEYTEEYPWGDREIRFNANYLVDGDMWGYGSDNQELQLFLPGWDAENGTWTTAGRHSAENYDSEWWNVSETGYYMRKFLDPSYDMTGTLMHTTPWFFLRLAEIYLNYAECQIELGNNGEALQYINLIRNRALLPSATGADIRAEYEYERQMELLFEGQRFFDIRRWKILDKIYAEPLHFVKVQNMGTDANGKIKKSYTCSIYDEVYDWDLEDWVMEVKVKQRRYAGEKHYWLPIPRWELNKCPFLDALPYE
ncbi:MAG: RagB/SusD family nutrient uptake outer membrane protein [Muribaculaceae bacterium]|nr:RagB/SusD family nutrient uptake outer membrane protein [Muribaculaceae bacterium]